MQTYNERNEKTRKLISDLLGFTINSHHDIKGLEYDFYSDRARDGIPLIHIFGELGPGGDHEDADPHYFGVQDGPRKFIWQRFDSEKYTLYFLTPSGEKIPGTLVVRPHRTVRT